MLKDISISVNHSHYANHLPDLELLAINCIYIEVGRYFGIDITDRFCIFCLLNNDILIIEDEYHVFFKCPRFNDIRQNYLFNWYTGNTYMADFSNIMSSQNDTKIRY